MLKFTRTLSELIILVFALNLIYDHVHQAWLNQLGGFWNAVGYQWHIARYPMLGAVAVVLIVLGLEIFFVKNENKDQKRRDAVLFALVKKLGVTEADIKEQEEIVNGRAKKK